MLGKRKLQLILQTKINAQVPNNSYFKDEKLYK